MMNFTSEEIAQMRREGRDPQQVAQQFSKFETGFPSAKLLRPAVKGDGIVVLTDDEIFNLLEQYEALIENKRIAKFVPASGAASRMFKELYGWLESAAPDDRLDFFFAHLSQFPFWNDLSEKMAQKGISLAEKCEKRDYQTIVSYILTEMGLNYGNLPKGLLNFHRYEQEVRTAVEEHLVEAALYARNADGTCDLHFTVSPQHEAGFKELLQQVKTAYEKRYGVTYRFSFSQQSPATDTLAADLQNRPFYNEKGELLFRPGGHGALLQNLNHLDYDLIFVKNIDNVTKEQNIEPTVLYKKILASYLLELKLKTDFYLQKLAAGDVSAELKSEIKTFAKEKLFLSEVTDENLFDLLNRPMRICGMVKNEGEPGGGPYWTKNTKGKISLQIVESSQMNLADEQQKALVARATHFNPVDMVCAFKDFRGQRFDLSRFVDSETGFISSKSYGDRKLKAMELPGLWNGAMADWITLFVEVPIETFNPVKTVFDLLKR